MMLTPQPLLVPFSRKSRTIPLLPLWALRPIQSLSACTVQLYLYSPYGPYGLYRASVPVQYSYTSTPPMCRTACTEPQCLYKGELYLYPRLPTLHILPYSTCILFYIFYSNLPYPAVYLSFPSVLSSKCRETTSN